MRVEGGGKYQVKLVPTNCHQEEVIFEIVSALDHLNAITTEIFSTLRNRIAEQKSTVASITARVAVVSEKVTALKSNTKALQIVSAAKFPEEVGHQTDGLRIKSLPILSLKALPPQRTITDSYETMARIKTQRNAYEVPIKSPDEVLQSYRVRDYNYLKGSNLAQLETAYEPGLGHPPPELSVIDSFFLFNTTENPYQNYRVVERTGANVLSKIARKAAELRDNKASEAKPDTESDTDPLRGTGVLDDFYYNPSLAQIPDIDVPDHLPDLPGLADTLDFSQLDSASSLFPIQRPASLSTSTSSWGTSLSSTITPITPINPISSLQTPSTSTPTVAEPIKPALPVPTVSSMAPVSNIPPPPPMPVPGALMPIPTSGGIPPPPPPPPPMQAASTAAATPAAAPPSTKHLVGGGASDLQSSLMAAIREAGGSVKALSGQKKRQETRRKKQEEKEKAAGAGGGSDMMADLKNSLAMRRRGISGLNDKKQPGLGDIMQKIASTIPLNDDSVDSGPGGISEDDDWD